MNSRIYLDVLQMRRPVLNYVSPAICDAVFSSTSFPTLMLDALPVKDGITGLRITFTNDSFRLDWDNYPGAICYSVYKVNDANDPFGAYTLIAECITDPIYIPENWEIPFDPNLGTCYVVTAITLTGETPVSSPLCKNEDDGGEEPPPDDGECISNDSPLPDATEGEAYSVTFLPDGPAAGPVWTITSGVPPDGLVLNSSTGELAGTPTESGDFTFTVRLTKDGGGFCEKEFELTVLEGLELLAWWTMDSGTPIPGLTDSVSGLLLAPLAGAGFMSTPPGKVANGFQHISSIGQSVVSGHNSASLALTGTQAQVTVACWVNIVSVNNPFLLNSATVFFNFDQGAFPFEDSFNISAVRENDGLWNLFIAASGGSVGGGAGPIQMADPGGWHFLVFTFDCATGILGLSINNSVMQTLATGLIPAPSATHSFGQTVLGTDANDAWTTQFDEFAIFDKVLSAEEIDHLWNAGAGRTYPP